MRAGRLVLILLIGAMLAPGLWLRSAVPQPGNGTINITLTPIDDYAGVTGTLSVTGAWQLHGEHPFFGGFSAMAADDDALLIGSDRGWMLHLPLGEGKPQAGSAPFYDYARRHDPNLDMIDLESMTFDPASNRLWTAYESDNAVRRADRDYGEGPGGAPGKRADGSIVFYPLQMSHWGHNAGAETMTRLANGRFLIIAEGETTAGRHDALLFAGDPIGASGPWEFVFASREGYAPVDATTLPDGRVLIVLRRVRYGVPAKFDAALMIADPQSINAHEPWTGQIIARLNGAVFGENFEGIAYVPARGGAGGSIYVVSDDNLSMFQRTLLVRLNWPADTDPPNSILRRRAGRNDNTLKPTRSPSAARASP